MTKAEQKKEIEQTLVETHGIPPDRAKMLVKTWYESILEEMSNDPDLGYREAVDENAVDVWLEEMLPEILDEIANRSEIESVDG